MQWLTQNWIWIVFFVLFIGMHLVGHGGHGGARDDQRPMEEAQPGKDKPQSHQHFGLAESFLYGAYAGLVFVPIYNFLQRCCGVARPQSGR